MNLGKHNIYIQLFFSADLTLYAGDFNNEPKDVPYQIGITLYKVFDVFLFICTLKYQERHNFCWF